MIDVRMKTGLLFPAFALLVLAGCQTVPDQGVAAVSEDPATADAGFRVAVKNTEDCIALRAAIRAGEADAEARAAFVAECLEELPPGTPVPPGLHPTPELRCEWAAAEIEAGRTGLIPGFVRHCAATCAHLAQTDTEAHERLCVLPPRPPLPEPRQARCDSLTAELEVADTASPGYHELARHRAAVCGLPPPPRPNPPQLPPARQARCDSLQTVLAGLDTNSADYQHFLRHVAAVCALPPPPRPERPVPPPPPPAPPHVCARQAEMLGTLTPGTPEYDRKRAHHELVCPQPVDPPGDDPAEEQ